MLNSLAAHYAGLAVQARDAPLKQRLFAEATAQLNKADSIGLHSFFLLFCCRENKFLMTFSVLFLSIL
jgi:hypothetical protein